MSREKRFSGGSLESTILALKNETIWSGFLWYLAAPPGEEYVHNPRTPHPPNPYKTASTNLENGEIQPIGNFYPTFAQKTTILRVNLP